MFHPDSYGYRPGRSALDAVGSGEEAMLGVRLGHRFGQYQTFFRCDRRKPGASSGCDSRPGKGNEPPHRESSLGLMEVTTWAKRRQSEGRAVTQVKRLSLVRR